MREDGGITRRKAIRRGVFGVAALAGLSLVRAAHEAVPPVLEAVRRKRARWLAGEACGEGDHPSIVVAGTLLSLRRPDPVEDQVWRPIRLWQVETTVDAPLGILAMGWWLGRVNDRRYGDELEAEHFHLNGFRSVASCTADGAGFRLRYTVAECPVLDSPFGWNSMLVASTGQFHRIDRYPAVDFAQLPWGT